MSDSKLLLEIVSTIINLGILVVAKRGLAQLKITKEDIQLREKRASIEVALGQIEFYREKILPKITEISIEKSKSNSDYKLQKIKLKKFDSTEIRGDETETKYAYINDITLVRKQGDLLVKIKDVANILESFSISFCLGHADKEVAMFSVAETFCSFVKENSFFYCLVRKEDKLNLYYSTIQLYLTWSKKLEEAKLRIQKHNIDKSLEEIKNS